jgi:hypothetical protein
MGEVYKRLAQGRLPASGGTTKLYDVPSSTEAIIKSINVSNNTASAREVTLHHTSNSASLADTNLILPGVSIEAGGFAEYEGTICMAATTEIHWFAAAADVISYTIWGLEIS